ncbi:hypothetical protein D9619_007745 [Psilocybe cf. subviscida]|uniref:MYND-type domain-containing protein n=1 Tax=Psilocybe cf. subviscida TaxID=2480587 RepID=A0A8H5ESB3_9AGAR|nr:hypothetical protein D9619_007745 [Psilocybe cf. subviscida]
MPPNSTYTPISRLLKQCQNCMKSESDHGRLSSCSGCKRAHYCSTECQRADWKSHKRICELTRSMRQDMKAHPDNSEMRLVGVPVAKSDQVSKKWVQQFRGLLTPTGYVALDLRANPERRLTHFLTVMLIPTFTAETLLAQDEDVRKAFVVRYAVVQRWDELHRKSENLAALKLAQDGIERSKEKYPESLGFVVAVLIPAWRRRRRIYYTARGPSFGTRQLLHLQTRGHGRVAILPDVVSSGAVHCRAPG